MMKMIHPHQKRKKEKNINLYKNIKLILFIEIIYNIYKIYIIF